MICTRSLPGWPVSGCTRAEAVRAARAAALYGVLVHGNEIYGTGAVYLRSKNIVPPSTENAGRGMRGRGL